MAPTLECIQNLLHPITKGCCRLILQPSAKAEATVVIDDHKVWPVERRSFLEESNVCMKQLTRTRGWSRRGGSRWGIDKFTHHACIARTIDSTADSNILGSQWGIEEGSRF
jgi:hypothetical protein